jgi:TatD DNase family protein
MALDVDRILVETDSPFLAPQAMRGRDNEPANVMTTIAEIARVRDVDVDTIVEATAKNARAAFVGLT